MKIHSIYDNGGETCDRYTVFFKGRGSLDCDRRFYVAMSERPNHPQGFCQHGSAVPGRHIGKRIAFEDLPDACKSVVMDEIA